MSDGHWRRGVVLAVALVGTVAATSAQAPAPEASGPVVRIGIARQGRAVTIESLPLEEYVARVISGEGQPNAEPAAQEALAIVVRTFALANQRRHRADGYDLCDTTHCQVLRPALPAARAAALATRGQVLLDRGRPAFVFYSAHNGGTPALASEVWPGATDYPPSHAHDDVCADEPGWTSEVTRADVERVLRAAGASGRHLQGLRVLDRTPSERVGRLRADGFTPSTIAAHEFRMAMGRVLGVQVLRSTAFDITTTSRGFRFSGVGYGHGVGLCVVGAGRRAARGDAAADILRAYFRDLTIGPVEPALTTARAAGAGPRPGLPTIRATGARPTPPTPASALEPLPSTPMPFDMTEATALAPPDVRLSLPPQDAAEQGALLMLIRQTRDVVAARALIQAPPYLAVTVHPTMEAFSRATGQPWWVSASSVGTTIDLGPIRDLRQRGVLDSVVRYEVASAVVAPQLRHAPAWVRVGAARYFSGAEVASAAANDRVECPSDAELLRPVSGGAQREAFARAEQCVRRAVSKGRRLTSIR